MKVDTIADESDDPAKEFGSLEVWNGKKRYVLRDENGHFVTWRSLRTVEQPQTNIAVADGGVEMPEEPEVEKIEFTKDDPNDSIDLKHAFVADPERGEIKWEISWDGGEQSGWTDRISSKHKAIIYPNDPTINGRKTSGTKLKRKVRKQLKTDLDAVKQYRKKKQKAEREAELAKDLVLTVENISFKTGTFRTKYSQEARVLTTNKRELSDEENKQLRALKRELGHANDLPKAGDETPFTDVVDGVEFTAEQAIEFAGAQSELLEIEEANKRQERIDELREQYPALVSVPFDPDEMEAALENAEENGEETVLKKTSTHCNDSSLECSTDLITVVITADGVEKRRTHTY